MQVGMIIAWFCLVIYVIVLYKTKRLEKKDKKWMYMMVALALAFSVMLSLNISLNFVVTFLNNTFGKISRMVVTI